MGEMFVFQEYTGASRATCHLCEYVGSVISTYNLSGKR